MEIHGVTVERNTTLSPLMDTVTCSTASYRIIVGILLQACSTEKWKEMWVGGAVQQLKSGHDPESLVRDTYDA